MHTIKIVMKTGQEFIIECEKAIFNTHSITGELVGYKFDGVKGNYPMYICMTDVAYILELKS